MGDPIGAAIRDYAKSKKPADIVVKSDICEDDIIPVELLFRGYDDMPDLEKKALALCEGKVLDIGAGAGAHALALQDMGMEVHCIDLSAGAVDWMNKQGLKARQKDFYHLREEKYDTLLLLMNGLGVAGTLKNLPKFLRQAKQLLHPGGKILCDSSDIRYLYEEEDGSLWMDLNSEYYGNFRFTMQYQKEVGNAFDWLYVDFDNLFQIAQKEGFKAQKIFEQNDHYLAELTLQK